jgi:EmrB/QacA subfamily drug resistance transporter
MTAAALGDRFGRRRVYAAGLGLFGASSVACALASNVGTLIAARTVQGVGAAMVIPMALALLNAAVPPQRRGWAIGIYGSVTTVALTLGPILGGAVTEGLGWQWIFWFNVPIALGAIPFLFARVEESFGPTARLDLPGLTLVTLAALGLVWGLVRANSVGWAGVETLTALVVGALAAVAFVLWERGAPAPMLPLRLFRSRAFSGGNAAIFLLNACITGAIFLMPQFQQIVLAQGPLDAGLRMLPWGIAPFLVARRAGVLADQIGERVLAVTGLALATVGMVWIALIAAPGQSYADQIAPMAISGVGFGVSIPALTRAVTSTVAPADIGKASGAFSNSHPPTASRPASPSRA